MKTNFLLLCAALLLLMASCKKDETNTGYVKINGVKWEKTNTVIDGEGFFGVDEAQDVAASVGRRLPTIVELEALVALGSTWDDALKGRWFGEDHALKDRSEKSIFLPAAGFRIPDGTVVNQGEKGGYWFGEKGIPTGRMVLEFSEDEISTYMTSYRNYSVRCVRD